MFDVINLIVYFFCDLQISSTVMVRQQTPLVGYAQFEVITFSVYNFIQSLRTPGFIKEIRTNSLSIRKLNG